MPARPRAPLARIAILTAAAAAVVASQVIAPLTASAVTPPPKPAQHHPAAPPTGVADPTPPTSHPLPWSAARAKPHVAPQSSANAAAFRAQVIANAGTTERTASYSVSAATLRFLRVGLGIPLGASTTFTGVRSGSSLTVSLPAPERLRASVPGASMPAFTHSLLTIDRRTGAATLTASAPAGSLKVTIPDVTSTTLSGLSGTVTARVPVLGQTATLSGSLGYQAGAPVTVALRGTLPAGADVKHGVAELGAGATVTAATAGGLRVAGPATLGPAGHQLAVTVAGAVSGTVTGRGGWNLAVTSVTGAPLSGLTLAPGASGSVTAAHDRVTYDVKGSTARPWEAAPGVAVAGAVEFSNDLPNGSLVPAPGLTGSGSWADVTGTVALASGVSAHGSAAINLATGQGLLTSAGRTPVTMQTPKGTVIHDSAGFHGGLTVSSSGQVTASLPRQLSRWTPAAVTPPATTSPSAAQPKASAAATARSAARASVAPQAATGTSASYTLSGPVLNFITSNLHIPLSSATLTGTLSGSTLTLSAAAPTAFPSSVPSWLPSPSYVNTQVTVDEAANTVTLVAQAGTSSGLTATLSVAIANAATSDLSNGTDVTGSLTLGGVPFVGGATAGLTFTLGYASGALKASLAGSLTSAATFANGVVTIPAGTSLTLATGSGLTLNGVADLTYNGQTTEIAVNGTLTSISNWSLSVSNASGASWQPAAGLTITPNFSGSVSDANGSVSFDLGSGTGSATWVSPDQGSMVSVSNLEISNAAPGATAACKASDNVAAGDLWIGIGGTFSYVPANLNLSATGCFDLSGKHATISTVATGNLTSQFGATLPFRVDTVGLTAHIGGTYSLTGTAAVTVTGGGVSSNPQFNVGLQLSSAGITAGIGVSDLGSALGVSGLSGSGALYVSTVAVKGFDPATLSIAGQSPFDLPAGLSVALNYTLPSGIESKLQQLIPGLGNRTIPGLTAGTSLQAVASLSTSGFTVDLGVSLGTTSNGLTLFNSNNSALYLNRFDIKLALGAQNSLSLSGTGYLVLPPLAPGLGSSNVSVTISGSFNITSLTISLGFNFGNWSPAFGVTGLSVQDFGGTFGLTLESGVPTPSLGVYGDNIQLPPSWNQAIGMVNGTSVWFNANLSLTQPVLGFKIYNPYGGPALTPLAIDPNASAAEVNSFVVNTASFWLAPAGGSTPAGDTLNPGVSVIFDASVDNVPVHVDAAVDLTAPSVSANASVGAFTIGPVQTSNTVFHLNLSPSDVSLAITGGVSYNNDTFNATVEFTLGSSMAGASIWLSITGGLPTYFYGGATLSGAVHGDGSGAWVSATGSGWLYAGGTWLGPVSFSFSLPGSLSWSDASNSITQLAQFFITNAGLSFNQVVTALEQFGYQVYDIINALSSIGQYGPQIANAFGFSTTYFDIWTYTNSGQFLVMDVAGGSQSPNAGIDTWTLNLPNSYNQNWAFVQSPYAGWYEIVSRGSGQCLSVGNNTSTPGNPLVQWPCGGAWNQLWYMGSISLGTNYYIESALDGEYADVAGAYPWAGGTIDQWYYNGGQNQRFWLTNSPN
jgi:ricin-type beta-trefoil lectin protein